MEGAEKTTPRSGQFGGSSASGWSARTCAALTLFILALAATCDTVSGATFPRYGGVLRRGYVGQVRTVHPGRASTSIEAEVARAVHAGLFRLDRSGEPVLDLAERAELEEEGKRVRITLRRARFHDGRAVSSIDVQASLRQTIAQPGPGELLAGLDIDEAITVVDSRTLTIDISAVPTDWRWLLASRSFAILPAEGAGRVGAGPFVITAMEADGTLRLAAHVRYHRGRPLLDGIVYARYATAAAAVFDHEHRGTHIVSDVTSDIDENIVATASELLALRVSTGSNALRAVVSAAVRRSAIVDVVLGGDGRVATGLLEPPAGGLAARQGQAEPTAEWAARVRLLYDGDGRLRRVAERLRVDLAEAHLNVELERDNQLTLSAPSRLADVALVTLMTAGPADIALSTLCGDLGVRLPEPLREIISGRSVASEGVLLVEAETDVLERAGLVVLLRRDRRYYGQSVVRDAWVDGFGVLTLDDAWLRPQP